MDGADYQSQKATTASSYNDTVPMETEPSVAGAHAQAPVEALRRKVSMVMADPTLALPSLSRLLRPCRLAALCSVHHWPDYLPSRAR